MSGFFVASAYRSTYYVFMLLAARLLSQKGVYSARLRLCLAFYCAGAASI